MIDVVFISDLHLHPDDQGIRNRFNQFITWAKTSVKTIYILGDFFHAWAGDDSINSWSEGIARQLKELTSQGIQIYYMHGNRDFLLGNRFASLAGWTLLSEPTIIKMGNERVLLVHGDRYCTLDKEHQRFRKLTRNKLFRSLFLRFPLKFREKMVNKVRDISFSSKKTLVQMEVVAESVINHMKSCNAPILVHGHTHKPGLTIYKNPDDLKRYVLSDWDDLPQILCYDNTRGFYFVHHEIFEEILHVKIN